MTLQTVCSGERPDSSVTNRSTEREPLDERPPDRVPILRVERPDRCVADTRGLAALEDLLREAPCKPPANRRELPQDDEEEGTQEQQEGDPLLPLAQFAVFEIASQRSRSPSGSWQLDSRRSTGRIDATGPAMRVGRTSRGPEGLDRGAVEDRHAG